jgi:cysteine desulfurase / selenocysteine lyase
MVMTEPLEKMRACRADFPLLERVLSGRPINYLDSAATALKPRAVIDAIVDYYARLGANIHRGRHALSEEASARFDEARERIAGALGCRSAEVVFVRNTTEALGVVAHGLQLKAGELVVTTFDAHHSQILPWRAAANVKAVRLDRDGRLDLDHYRALLKERPRVVALTHCSNVTGVYAPIDTLVSLARAAGALTVVDAAQSVPHRRVDVTALGVDFLAYSGHKVMGPTGIGVLYGRRELLDGLRPLLIGGGTVDRVTATEHQLRAVPQRLEAGTPHIDGVIGLGAAIDYLEQLGFDALEAHDARLSRALLDGAARRDYIQVIGPVGAGVERAAILSMTLRGVSSLTAVAQALSERYGIMCRTGHFCAQPLVNASGAAEALRASAYAYNTTEDIDAFFAALDELARDPALRA